MKILSKAVSLFAVLALVFGVVGCKGGGGKSDPPLEQNPNPEPIPVPQPKLVFSAQEPVLDDSLSVSVALSWSATNVDQCSASSENPGVWEGYKPANGVDFVSGLSRGVRYVFSLTCVGNGVSVGESVVINEPLPPPPPLAIKASLVCDSPGGLVSTNPQGFVLVRKECVITAENDITISSIPLVVEGDSGKLLEVRAMQQATPTPIELTRSSVVDGVATLALENFNVFYMCDGYPSRCGIKRKFFLEARFAPLNPLDTSESSRDISLNVMASADIKTVENVAFSNTFPVQVGLARMVKGKLFFTTNNEIFRRDTESGNETVLTYSYGSTYTLHDDVYVSRDGKRAMFQRGYSYILDTDGEGCTSADIPVVVSLGCNKGFTTVPLVLHDSTTTGGATITDGFSPDGTMLAYVRGSQTAPGGSFLDNVYLAQISTGAIEQITTDQYGGSFAVIGSTGVYFYSCRPDCGIYWRAVDFSTGKPTGETKLIYGDTDGGLVLTSVSADEKQFLLYEYINSDYRVLLVNIDGTSRVIGSGMYPKFASDGKIFWVGSWDGGVLADGDGSNQVFFVIPIAPTGFAFIP